MSENSVSDQSSIKNPLSVTPRQLVNDKSNNGSVIDDASSVDSQHSQGRGANAEVKELGDQSSMPVMAAREKVEEKLLITHEAPQSIDKETD